MLNDCGYRLSSRVSKIYSLLRPTYPPSILLFPSRIEWTNLFVAPVPYVVKEAPDYLFVTIYHLLLGPEISRAKSWKVLKEVHHFVKIGLDLGHVSFLWLTAYAFYHFHSTIKSIHKISINNSCATVVRKVLHQVYKLSFILDWFEKPDVVDEPLDDLGF